MPHAVKYSAEVIGARFYRVSKREKFASDIRTSCQFEISLWKSKILV